MAQREVRPAEDRYGTRAEQISSELERYNRCRNKTSHNLLPTEHPEVVALPNSPRYRALAYSFA